MADKEDAGTAGKATDAGTDETKKAAKGGDAESDKGGDTDQTEVEKWKALARQHENLWKSTGLSKDELPEARELLKRAKATETASKTAEDRIAALEQKIAEADARAARLEVAAAKGLTPAMAKRLVGTTRDELEADADELVKELKGAGAADGKDGKGTDDTSHRPTEKLRPGAVPQAEPEVNDPTKLAAMVPRL